MRQKHHDLSQSLQERQEKQVDSLSKVISEHNDPFIFEGKGLVSLFSQAVMPDKVVHGMCNLAAAGQDAYETFVCDQLFKGTVNMWARMKKMNDQT